jgi:uncharacterized protein YcgI (DUF1989 family)
MSGQSRSTLNEWILEPGTGKAIELRAGQILRIEQVEGGQCVDFNCFNLHDYKEFMHCGRTRTVHGFNPSTGTFLWSAPPRERAMLYILEDTVGRICTRARMASMCIPTVTTFRPRPSASTA